MRRTMLCSSAIVLGGFGLFAAAVQAKGGDPGNGDCAEVVKFLKESVLGRTLASPKTSFKWDENKAEAEFESRHVYHNFSETAHGFSFDSTSVSNGFVYDLDKDGRRIEPGRVWGGTTVIHFEIGERASTKRLTGYARVVSTTNKESRPAGTVIVITSMKVSDGKLIQEETRPGYADAPSAGGKYKPVSSDAKVTYSLEDGKLRVESDVTYFDVDPETLRRSSTPQNLPPMVSKEVADR